jgi:hypothetical protein
LAAKPPKPTKKLLGAAKPTQTPPPEADVATALCLLQGIISSTSDGTLYNATIRVHS